MIVENMRLLGSKEKIRELLVKDYEARCDDFDITRTVNKNLDELSEFLHNPGKKTGILLTGPTGTGKTMLSHVLVTVLSEELPNRWVEEEIAAIPEVEPEYLKEIKKWEEHNIPSLIRSATYNYQIYCTPEGLRYRREKLKEIGEPIFSSCDADRMEELYLMESGCEKERGIRGLETDKYLLLDDIGREQAKVSVYGRLIKPLESVVNSRYEKGLNTIYTTNLGMEEIRKYYGDRVFSRLQESCKIIEVNGKDFRLTV